MAYITSLEKEGRYRCGYIYRIKARCGDKEIEGFIDLNHKAFIEEGRIFFEKGKTLDGKEWDYRKWPLEVTVLSLELFSNDDAAKDELIKEINCMYRKQEEKWKI